MSENQIVVYDNGEIEIQVSIDSGNETIWLSQVQLSKLFETSVDNISLHLKNIYKEQELDEKSTVEYFSVVRKEGNRNVKRNLKHYNLDAVISLGYRVNSVKSTRFRQWATKILKTYISNGYVINSDKITNDRFVTLENDVNSLKNKIAKIDTLITSDQINIKQGIFCSGQIFDAYSFVNDLFRSAKKEIILIDNYIDDTILTLFSKYPDINFTIITKSISKQLKLDIDKYNKQFSNLAIKKSNRYHDRFLIIDKKEAYHIGASLKDLGKKVFGFNKIDVKLVMENIDA